MQEFICDLRFRHLKVWREANFPCPCAINKKAVTYHTWCGSSESGPDYLRLIGLAYCNTLSAY